jgi:hypothetical protein
VGPGAFKQGYSGWCVAVTRASRQKLMRQSYRNGSHISVSFDCDYPPAKHWPSRREVILREVHGSVKSTVYGCILSMKSHMSALNTGMGALNSGSMYRKCLRSTPSARYKVNDLHTIRECLSTCGVRMKRA